MENQENNNLSELEQLKAQYETLKEQFDQQEIVNDRLMKSSIKRNVDFFMRYRRRQFIIYPLAIFFGLLIIKWDFDNNLSLRLFWMTYCLVSFAIEMWLSRKLRVKTIENNDLLTLANQARGFKKSFTVFTILSAIPMLILMVGWLLLRYGHNIQLPSLTAFASAIGGVLVLFVVVGAADIRYKSKPCDEIIRQIEAAETTSNRKISFDKKQKWLCVAMMVAFLCLDVWAYAIVASRLKLPPMWRTMKYERAEDDFAVEGRLAIWEVYADTVVPEKDVAALMEHWQLGDSLVFMKGDLQKAEIEVDNQSVHSWKSDNGDEKRVRLYMLKKATPEGPAVSSAVLDGKPMVKMLTVNKPSKYPSTEPVPMTVLLTPEASQLWYQFTSEITGHRAALTLDGVVIQDWKVMCGLDNGSFFIMKDWSSKDELEVFCKQLVKQ